MRARNLKPGLFKNEKLGTAEPLYTLVFEGLWTLADREGRLEDRPLRIHAEINPYRTALGTEEALNWLTEHGFIVRYRANGTGYIWIPAFLHHQNPHVREPPSKLPAPEKTQPDQGNGEAQILHGASIVPAPVRHKSGPSDSLFSESGFPLPPSPFIESGFRIPDSRAEAFKKREGKRRKLEAMVAELANEKRWA